MGCCHWRLFSLVHAWSRKNNMGWRKLVYRPEFGAGLNLVALWGRWHKAEGKIRSLSSVLACLRIKMNAKCVNMSRANFGSYKINLIVMLITIKTLREKGIFSVKLAIATNLRQKSWHAFPLLQYLSHKFITFSLPTPPPLIHCCQFIVMKSSLPVYNIIGEKGAPDFNDVTRYWPQNTLSTHFRAISASCAKDFCHDLLLSVLWRKPWDLCNM